MKKIDLPVTRNFTTRMVDIHQAIKELASGKDKVIPLGTIDFGVSGKLLDQARENGGMIIWSATCLEEKLDAVIMRYVFSYENARNSKGREFFANRIIQDDHFSYSMKKSLVVDIMNSESLLEGREKDELAKALKDVMGFRNAFAHGDIKFEVDTGCILSYWSGGAKRVVLSEEYWQNLEDRFKRAHKLVERALANLNKAVAESKFQELG